MNPIYWKREHQIAFVIAVVVCACLGVFAGSQRVDPSADLYWVRVGLWGVAGAAMGTVGASIGQLIRNRRSG